ncbi:uncharacterized protein LOC111598778 isoform X2 [Drosophila hydei]|uniref:Uncharacterized protein LOC111598778 isoform X2 n=1 Tax=Drosophila hydei TaxID=7224 RepID=A0A6J1LQM0_DROHY|nr:uncharacterized protein LOC111598778 isoform X2 [Drosophila hydei]
MPRPAVPKPQAESFDRRPSLGIALDFPALIQARKAELEVKRQQRQNKTSSSIDSEIKNENMFQPEEDTTKQLADDSFDVLERMCDKTASDPDSTLFQYLHSDDKEQVLAIAKRRSSGSDKSGDIETAALCRMLEDLGDQDQLCNESPLKSAECTQLEDVEAPSRFWDNDSLLNGTDSLFQPKTETSPVKMVGLLRPSTILEASEADLTGLQSDESCSLNSSFLTANTLKTEQGEDETSASGSSCYETAADNSLASSSKEATTTLNVDDLFYAAIAKAKPHGISKGEQQELLVDLQETLLDLALTDAADNTIIELSSSSENEEDEHEEQLENESIKKEELSLIDSNAEEDKENKSMRLNGTIEEMEYMLKKAQEYMEAKKDSPEHQSDPNIIHLHQKPMKQNTFVMSPQKESESQLPQSSSKLLTASGRSRHLINMDQPKSKFFKQPTSIPMRRLLKHQKDNFAHIVSPIRTYTQKSGTAPLMSMFREKANNLSVLQLEEESQLCQFNRGHIPPLGNGNSSKLSLDCFNPSAPFLPKKAYISSELKQVVDERTPVPMPSVSKIQKYLNSAAEPSVLRHDGKMKMPGQSCSNINKNASHIPRRPNQSLADLSLASGDISLYTLKDAQKF